MYYFGTITEEKETEKCSSGKRSARTIKGGGEENLILQELELLYPIVVGSLA